MIYNWANNSLTSKGYEQNVHTWLHAALALISKQAHLLTIAHAFNTVQFKVNFPDPSTVWQWYICIQAYCNSDWISAPVCVEYTLSSACQCNRIVKENVLHSLFCFGMLH